MRKESAKRLEPQPGKHEDADPAELSNEALFRAQAAKKERDARLPLATKLRMLKEMADWAQPLEQALKESDERKR